MTDSIIEYVSNYYTEKIQQHGPTPKGVDWNGVESQELRFEKLVSLLPAEDVDLTLLDFGCGYAALFAYLEERRKHVAYTGLDCSAQMIDAASRLYRDNPNCRFLVDALGQTFDYTLASGIFNVRGDYADKDWWNYCIDVLGRLNESATRGFSFNMLTSYSDADKMRDYLYYADPCAVFDFCKRNFSRNVALLHDYGLYEFTILVRK